MKLELKHLAPYLPYRIKFERNVRNDDEDRESIKTMDVIYADSVTWVSDFYNERRFNIYFIKPILRPLSDLTKEITHNGETFIPLEVCCKDFTYQVDEINEDGAIWTGTGKTDWAKYTYRIKKIETTDGDMTLLEEFSQDKKYKTQLLNYDRFFQLVSWHFDVFGLIEKDLAIDLNSLEQ